MTHEDLFRSLIGRWGGTCRTWFEPGKLEDESNVEGEFTEVFRGKFVRHVYRGSMKGKPRHGEELIARNGVTKQYQVTWVDDFHMNYAVLVSLGPATERGFSVNGQYDIADDPPWGWRTEYELKSVDELVITAYNIMPGEAEAKAVETLYHRIANEK
ncbi:MAG: DUF1579 domain-containing protein [Bacteroidetes bacterium]|jgi:hypothetical protein|nr:DUF1579 domain-containing protein [Bacteroidota bacterium]